MRSMKAKVKRKNGRPTKYDERFNDIAFQVCMQFGADDIQLSKTLGISKATLNNWKKRHPGFIDSLKKGKQEYDNREVVAALLHRAKGYSHPDVHISTYEGNVIITDIVKHYPPDVGACTLYLCNRDAENWRSVNNTILQTSPKGIDERLKEIAGLLKKSDEQADTV